jgi:hypothetical protein
MGYVLTRGGLGDVSTQQITASGQGAASGALAIATAPTVGGKVSGAGTLILSSAPFAGPAAPIVAIAGAVVTIAGQIMSFVGLGDGCGQSCILTSDWANKAEVLLRQNITAYFNSPVRNQSTQTAALAGFDAIWNQLETACSSANLGAAGQNCIGDRQAGACKWKQTGTSPWPGGPAIGQCWNWFSAYRDPIAHDPNVVPDSSISLGSAASSADSSLASLFSASGDSQSLVPLLVIGGLVALGVAL